MEQGPSPDELMVLISSRFLFTGFASLLSTDLAAFLLTGLSDFIWLWLVSGESRHLSFLRQSIIVITTTLNYETLLVFIFCCSPPFF